MKQNGHRNKYCSLTNLENESDVEQLFVIPLLSDLGYTGDYLRTKTSIPSATIRKGRNKKAYVPDYLGYHTKTKKKPVLVIDAKHPNEPVEEGVDDAQLYASVIRRKMESPKPEQYCVGVNGRRLILKHYESDATLLAMDFLDFTDDNAKFSKLRSLIARDRIHATEAPTATTLRMSKCNLSEVNAAFAYCHQYIYRKDDISQAEGFTEFVKIIALKLMSDRRLRDAYPEIVKQDIIEVPIHDVDFSEAWIRRNEANTRNPINDLQFRAFMADMERQTL